MAQTLLKRLKVRQTLLNICVLAIALVCTIVSLPSEISYFFRPDFVVLVLLLYCWYRPGRIGVFAAFVTGLLVDVLTFGLLGVHALAKSVIVYLGIRLSSKRLKASIVLQLVAVLGLLLLQSLVVFTIGTVTGSSGWSNMLILLPASSIAVWIFLVSVPQILLRRTKAPIN